MASPRPVPRRHAVARAPIARRRPAPPFQGEYADRPTPTAVPALLTLQSRVGNRGVTQLLRGRPPHRGPAELQRAIAPEEFDPRTVRNELIRAINTTPVQLPSYPGASTYLPRKVNAGKVIEVLDGLTASQVAAVRKTYFDHEGRALDTDLFGSDKGGTNLSVTARARIAALLKGTTSDIGTAPDGARSARNEARAAELLGLLTDNPNADERERIMALLRNEQADNGDIAVHYRRLFSGDLYRDLRKYLSTTDATRAELLVVNDRAGADAVAVEQRRKKIDELNKAIEQQTKAIEFEQHAMMRTGIPKALKSKFEKDRREQVEALQGVLERARSEAAASGGSAAGAERVRQILAHKGTGASASLGDSLAASLLATEASTVKALGEDSPPDLTANRMVQAFLADKLTPAFIETELRGLRQQADLDARAEIRQTMTSLGNQLDVADRMVAAQRLEAGLGPMVAKRIDSYFARLRAAFAEKDPFHGKFGNFLDYLLRNRDEQAKTGKLGALLEGKGELDPVAELDFALSGTKKDIETVKRVLAGKRKSEIIDLQAKYEARTKKNLREELLGPVFASKDEMLAFAGKAGNGNLMKGLAALRGKATGHDAIVVREMLDVPAELGGDAEAEFLATQARKEAQWAVSDAGTMGQVHDYFDDEARKLMDETADTAMADLRIYRSYLAAGKRAEADAMLAEIRLDRARMRVDRAAYSEQVDKFRAAVAAALSMAVDLAVLVFLPAAAPFLVGVGLTAAGHIAVNLVAYGDKYSDEMLRADVLGAIGSAAGAKFVELAKVAKSAAGAAKVAESLADDVAVAASKTIAREASGLASPSILSMAKRQATNIANDFAENVAGDLATGLLKGKVDVDLAGAAKGTAFGQVGKSLRGLRSRPGTAGAPMPEVRIAPDGGAPGAGHDGGAGTPHGAAPKTEGAVPKDAPDAAVREGAESAGKATDAATSNDSGSVRKSADADSTQVDSHPPDMSQGDRVREGSAHQAPDPSSEIEAWKLYGGLRAQDPHREVGLMWNERVQQWAVVQGGPNETAFGAAMRELNWAAGDITIARHSHPTRRSTGATHDRDLLPSGRGGDVSGIAKDAARGGPDRARAWEAIDVMVRRGPGEPPTADRTWVVYDRATNAWIVDYPMPGARRGRRRIRFTKIESYHRWFRRKFGTSPGTRLPDRPGTRRASTTEDINEVREQAQDPRSHGVPEEALARPDDSDVDLDLYERHLMAELDYGAPEWTKPGRWRLPAAKKGSWDPVNSPGDGYWTPHDPVAYGLERGQSVLFRSGVPDLSHYAQATPGGHPGTVDVPGLTLTNRALDRMLTVEAIARRENWPVEQVYAWLAQGRLRLHHVQGTVMQIVPNRLHDALGHQGSMATGR